MLRFRGMRYFVLVRINDFHSALKHHTHTDPKWEISSKNCFWWNNALIIWLLYITGLIRHQGSQKKWKRTMKVMKVKSKARYYQNSKFHTFFIYLGSFGDDWLEINFDLNFKVLKAKKATMIGQNSKLQFSNFMSQIWCCYITSDKYRYPTANFG